MKINEFVEAYKKNKMMDIKKYIHTKDYVGIAYKETMCELVLDACMTQDDSGIKFDSVNQYILFTVLTIEMHTDLEFSRDDEGDSTPVDDFDLLCENQLLEKVINTFKTDYDECQVILNMMASDRIKNFDTLERKIYRFVKNIMDVVEENGEISNVQDIVDLIAKN